MSGASSGMLPDPELAASAVQRQGRQADYGQRWGEGAARCFSIEGDFLDEDAPLRLMPMPDSFLCPISATIMQDPVATVDGCSYERDYIERWFRERRQARQPVTSPTTGLELPSTTLMPLKALQRAIEAYLAHRPEIKRDFLVGRSFEEAAQLLQVDLLEKQAQSASIGDEIRRLREANKALLRALRKQEQHSASLTEDLRLAGDRIQALEEILRKDGRPPPEAPLAAPSSSSSSSAPSTEETSPEPVGSRSELCATEAAASASERLRQTLSVRDVDKKQPRGGLLQSRQFLSLPCGAVLAVLAGVHLQRWMRSPETIEPLAMSTSTRRPTASTPVHATKPERSPAQDKVPTVNKAADASSSAGGAAASWKKSSSSREAAWKREAGAAALKKESSGGSGSSRALPDARTELGAPTRAPLRTKVDEGSLGPGMALIHQVEQLRTGSPEAQHRATLHLLQVAGGGTEARAAILQAGAVMPLVDLLAERREPGLQEACAAVLGTLAADGEAPQSILIRAGAVPALVKLLSGAERDQVTTKAAASVLRNLAANNDRAQHAISQAGAIALLIKLLRHQDPGVQAQAAGALGNLAGDSSERHYEKQVAIARAGAIPPLLLLLDGDTSEVREMGAASLRMLATNNVDNQVAIAQAGAIRPLVILLQDGTPSVREEAAAALGNLAFFNDETHPGNQAAIADAGAVAPLTKLLHDRATGVQEAAAGALRNLAARHPQNQESIAKGALPHLIRLLKQQGRPRAQAEAAGCIQNLAADNTKNQAAIVKAGALEPLIALLQGEAPQLREVAAGALWTLARDNLEIRATIEASGASAPAYEV